MRHLPFLLAEIAATVAIGSGCSSSAESSCDDYVYREKDIDVTPEVACAIATQAGVTQSSTLSSGLSGQACDEACGSGYGTCGLPDEYVNTYQAALPAVGDAGPVTCPSVTVPVTVHCATHPCTGRRTDGIHEPSASSCPGLGAYFAACSYLEAVSVHAFARLHRELRAHGAPDELLTLTRRAEQDEVRHAVLAATLARRFGVEPEEPGAPPSGVRSLFDVALENAVEGCVRETYGAAMACFHALRARDASVRAMMQKIAHDECEHAELAFRIAAWAMPRLRGEEREAIRVAMREAMQELVVGGHDMLDDAERAACGMPGAEERRKLVRLIDRDVLRTAA